MDSTMGQWRGIDPSLYWTPQSWSRIFLPRSPSCIISSSWLLHSRELGWHGLQKTAVVSSSWRHGMLLTLVMEEHPPQASADQWYHFHIC